jgi:hypothetical protein
LSHPFRCKTAGFLEFTLSMEYPLLLVAFALILFTRSVGGGAQNDLIMNDFPIDEVDQGRKTIQKRSKMFS